MKKILLIGSILILSMALFGCNTVSSEEEPIKEDSMKVEAVVRVIEHHNLSEEVKSEFDFPTTIKEGDIVTKFFQAGDPSPGVTVKLEMTVEVKKESDKYIVILKEDYNAKVGDKEAISYWKYEVSTDKVKLIDKNENGNLVMLIK